MSHLWLFSFTLYTQCIKKSCLFHLQNILKIDHFPPLNCLYPLTWITGCPVSVLAFLQSILNMTPRVKLFKMDVRSNHFFFSKPCTPLSPLHTFPLILSPFCLKSKFHTRATQSSFLLPLDLVYYPPSLLLHSHSGFPEVPRT